MTTSAPRSALAARSPGRLLLFAVAFCVSIVSGATALALSTPWLGLRLAPNFETGDVTVLDATGPADRVAPGVRLRGLEGGGLAVSLVATDLIEEPDFFDTYEEMATFFARQSEIARVLRSGEVRLVIESGAADEAGRSASLETLVVRPQGRPLESLPFVYWFQCFAGTAGFLIGMWVLALSPRGRAPRLFAAMGSMFLLFTVSAAVYSSRELAFEGSWFRVLASSNHAGAFLFGAALVGLFASYPKALLPARALLVLPAIVLPWLAADVFRWAPNQDLGSRLPVMLEMLTAMLLAGVQWFATRRDPRGRAALRWLGSAVILGCGLFVFMTVGLALLGWMPPIQQGYAFGFFLLMDVGLALGLRRHSLLGIDEWALRALLWLGAGLALVVLDLVLLLVLGASRGVSLGVALAICGLAYLPVRNWLWQRVVVRARLGDHELFERVLRAAFAPKAEERSRLWRDLLASVFDPLEVRGLTGEGDERRDEVCIERQGLGLVFPPIASLPGVVLEYPWRGQALFTPRHQRLATALVEWMRKAETAREAFLRGVHEERHRIARDLHDHLGAQLLTGLYAESAEQAREGIRHALSDMRSVVHELTRDDDLELDTVLADLRHETMERAAAAGLTLEWPLAREPLDQRVNPRAFRHLTAAMRELVSNVLRHGRAEALLIATRVRGSVLEIVVLDDGLGFEASKRRRLEERAAGDVAPESRVVSAGGRGLGNVTARAEELGGRLRLVDLRSTDPDGERDLSEEATRWIARSTRGAGALAVLEMPLGSGAAEARAS